MSKRSKQAAERGGLLDGGDGDGAEPDLALGEDAEIGTEYDGASGSNGYASVAGSINGAGADGGDGKLARLKAFLGAFSAKQWACAGISLMVVLGLAFMFAHRPVHPSHATTGTDGVQPAALEMSAEVHSLGTDHMGHAAPEGQHDGSAWSHESHDGSHEQQHDGSHEFASEHGHEQMQHHDAVQREIHHEVAGAEQHHIHVESEPEVEAPEGFEEIEGVDANPLPGENMHDAERLEDEAQEEVTAAGEHVPRIVHANAQHNTNSQFVPMHTVHDTVAVLSTGGDKPAHLTHDGHEETHGPHMVETHEPHDVNPVEYAHVFDSMHDVRWFHVLRDMHVWRVHGKWDNGKGAEEIGFHFTSWKPHFYDHARHGLGIHRQWQPMSELSLLTLRATPAELTPEEAHMEHEEVHDGTPTLIAIGTARATVEPPSEAHHETEYDKHSQRSSDNGIVLEGGEPIIVLYTPAHWTHEHKNHYAHRVLRVVARHALPHHPNSGL